MKQKPDEGREGFRRGFILLWIHTQRPILLDTDGSHRLLPVFSTEESIAAAVAAIRVPPHGVLGKMEVWMDARGGLKNATAGGGLHDMPLEQHGLKALWDTDSGFEDALAEGLAHLNDQS